MYDLEEYKNNKRSELAHWEKERDKDKDKDGGLHYNSILSECYHDIDIANAIEGEFKKLANLIKSGGRGEE